MAAARTVPSPHVPQRRVRTTVPVARTGTEGSSRRYRAPGRQTPAAARDRVGRAHLEGLPAEDGGERSAQRCGAVRSAGQRTRLGPRERHGSVRPPGCAVRGRTGGGPPAARPVNCGATAPA
ncbi:hypothetical protein SCWH03_48670 [Streptomyces pacificus]|uniref:Uncharacterized protein n=1 Tax=Streptomyces pacificus TaxID=2705029 RepID=A0A6A0B1R7_9ACTN|nr:hypothetical protein SCWH03_48670 [Streptomyces pacificus]